MLGLSRGKGYIERDYSRFPEFSRYGEFSGRRVPRAQWKDRINELNELHAQPVHWHKRHCKIKNQRSTSYCWAYGTVAAVEVALARQGIQGVVLNAHALAYRGKGGRNQGGYGIEACRYIQNYGIPSERALPEFSKTLRWTGDAAASAAKHRLVDFEEIGRNDFDGVVSALIGDDPCAVTLAYNWWRHLVCGVGVAYKDGDWGLIYANSWGTGHSRGGESGGYGIIWGSKAIPFEAVAVRHVKAREEK